MKLQIFEHKELGAIRTAVIDSQPCFVGKDVADILGYSNSRDVLRKHVDEEDKGVVKLDTLGGPQLFTTINESGLYSLILSSKMPAAKKFKRWVTSEVLPSIRKHGLYATDDLIADPDLAIAAFTALKEEREKTKRLQGEVAVKTQQIAELQPKATYYDLVLNCKDLLAISVIAKDYGKSARWMNKYLHDKGVQYRQGHIWLLYQKHAEKGYTQTKTHSYPGSDGDIRTKVHTQWTQKGRLFIYELLKADDILPLIEQDQEDES